MHVSAPVTLVHLVVEEALPHAAREAHYGEEDEEKCDDPDPTAEVDLVMIVHQISAVLALVQGSRRSRGGHQEHRRWLICLLDGCRHVNGRRIRRRRLGVTCRRRVHRCSDSWRGTRHLEPDARRTDARSYEEADESRA